MGTPIISLKRFFLFFLFLFFYLDVKIKHFHNPLVIINAHVKLHDGQLLVVNTTLQSRGLPLWHQSGSD